MTRIAEPRTPGQKWRWRRDLILYLAHERIGISQRVLADVFDLPRSRVATIVLEMDAQVGALASKLGESGRGREFATLARVGPGGVGARVRTGQRIL